MATQAAGITSTGTLLSEHRARSVLRVQAQAVAAAGLSLAIVAGAMGIWAGVFALEHYGLAALARWVSVWAWGAGLLTLTACAGLLRVIFLRKEWVRIYPSGLAVRGSGGIVFVPWDQIHEMEVRLVRYGLPVFTARQEAALLLRYGVRGQLRLTHALDGFDSVVQRVKQETYPRLLGEYIHAFNAGGVVAFGPIRLTGDGIAGRRRLISWQQLDAVSLERGVLRLTQNRDGRHSTISFPASRIPNIDLCLQLIQQLGRHS
jgi:hypothetical protein